MRTRRVLVASLAVALTASVAVCGLAGCASAKPTAAPKNPASSAATPSPSPAAPTTLSCEDLASPTALSTLLGVDVSTVDPHLRELTDTTLSYEIEAAGGISCLWGEPGAVDPGNADAARFSVQMLPHADTAWEWLPASSQGRGTTPGADYDGHPSRGGNCSIAKEYSQCWTDVFVNGDWLSATANTTVAGALTEAEFHATVLEMVPVLERYVFPSTSTAQPAMTRSQCQSAGMDAAMQSSFGVKTASFMGIETAVRIEDAMLFVPGREYCPYQSPADGSGGFLAAYTVNPHAKAEFAAFAALLQAQPITVATVPLTGAKGSISALGWSSVRSSGTLRTYRLDVLDGDDWIEIFTTNSSDAPAHTAAFADWFLVHRTP